MYILVYIYICPQASAPPCSQCRTKPKLSATATMGSINCAGRPGSSSLPNTVGSAAKARGGLHGTGFPGRAAKAAAADAGLGRSWVDGSASGVGGAFFLTRHLPEFFAWRRLQRNPCLTLVRPVASHRWSGSLRWRRTRSLASNGMRSAWASRQCRDRPWSSSWPWSRSWRRMTPAPKPHRGRRAQRSGRGRGGGPSWERRCQVRMQSALGDTRQDDPILRTGSMQIEVIAEEVEHPAYKHSKYGTTSQNSQKPQSLEDARAHQMGHRHPLEKASKHHSGDLHSAAAARSSTS